MKMRYLTLALGLGLGAASLSAEIPPYAITLDGLYARPFGSEGYSGSDGSGLGSSASFEWRRSDEIRLGLAGHFLQISTNGAGAAFGGADLTLRWLPLSSPQLEPYLLAGVGWDFVQAADRSAQQKGPGFVGQLGLGILIPLERQWAVELGLDYQARPATSMLSTLGARLGLQYRFDPRPKATLTPSPTPAPTPTPVAPARAPKKGRAKP